LATSDKTTIVIEKQPDRKMRVTLGSWDHEKVFLKDQMLEVRHAVPDARLPVARKTKATGRVGPTDPGTITRMARATPRATSSLITETALRPRKTALRPDATALRRDATALRPDARALRTSTDRSRL
jgi:hypothetical protein